jgi:hypothetical protein
VRLKVEDTMRKLLWSLTLFSALMMALPACGGGGITIRGTARMPGVDGTISLSDAPGSARMVTVQLEHLAPPQRLQSGHQYYALWFHKGSQTVWAGHIDYDEGARRGTAGATTPLQGFEVIISIENRERPDRPSDNIIIRRRLD